MFRDDGIMFAGFCRLPADINGISSAAVLRHSKELNNRPLIGILSEVSTADGLDIIAFTLVVSARCAAAHIGGCMPACPHVRSLSTWWVHMQHAMHLSADGEPCTARAHLDRSVVRALRGGEGAVTCCRHDLQHHAYVSRASRLLHATALCRSSGFRPLVQAAGARAVPLQCDLPAEEMKRK